MLILFSTERALVRHLGASHKQDKANPTAHKLSKQTLQGWGQND